MGCAIERPKVDELKFTANSGYGWLTVTHDGSKIIDSEVKGSYETRVPADSGVYNITFVSVPAGYSTTYIYHNDKLVAGREKNHSSRVTITYSYTHK